MLPFQASELHLSARLALVSEQGSCKNTSSFGNGYAARRSAQRQKLACMGMSTSSLPFVVRSAIFMQHFSK